MKKSTQWDIIGIFALILSLVGMFSFFFGQFHLTRYELTVETVLFAMGNPIMIALFIGFCFLSFAFGFYESKKDDQKKLT